MSNISVYSRLALVLLLAIGLSAPAHAFRSQKTQSYTDADYKGYQPKKLLLVVANAYPEFRQEVEKSLQKNLLGVGIELVDPRALFPPTRQYSGDARREILEKNSITGVLVIGLGAAEQITIPMVMTSYRERTYSFDGVVDPNAESFNPVVTGLGTPLSSEKIFSVVLTDNSAERVAWFADITVKAKGWAFVSSKQDARALSDEIMKTLIKDGHAQKIK